VFIVLMQAISPFINQAVPNPSDKRQPTFEESVQSISLENFLPAFSAVAEV
jgi:Na+-transporting methylmalonyl-CoA/oxaloacetate decarboxylase gamma subunit